jgi:hypothetical protein
MIIIDLTPMTVDEDDSMKLEIGKFSKSFNFYLKIKK